ncbi:uncharacterized protein [Halyomorpha halys]|uniref:uncharacterized protein n=1 Tax=Halyomorpha halys TaxID=286706 RepID=UPI0034D29661
MIKQLLTLCEEVGLYPNYEKTKLMTNGVKEECEINNHKLAYVEEYIYLGQLISFTDRGAKEVQRRLALGWNMFWSFRHIMKGKKSIDLKRQATRFLIFERRKWGKRDRLIYIELKGEFVTPEELFGFTAARSCTNSIFVLRQLIEKRMEKGRAAYIAFIELTYNSVLRHKMLESLKSAGIALTNAVKSIYREDEYSFLRPRVLNRDVVCPQPCLKFIYIRQ